MSKTRPRPKKRQPSAGGSKSRGADGGAAQRAAELLDRLLPETDLPSGTNYSDRQLKRQAVQEIRGTQRRAVEIFDRIEASLDEEKGRGESAADEERRKRRESDEEGQRNGELRENLRLAVEIEERMTERRDKSRERNLLMLLTAFSVVATIALAFIAALRGEPPYFGGSAIGFLLSGGGVYVLRHMFRDAREWST